MASGSAQKVAAISLFSPSSWLSSFTIPRQLSQQRGAPLAVLDYEIQAAFLSSQAVHVQAASLPTPFPRVLPFLEL